MSNGIYETDVDSEYNDMVAELFDEFAEDQDDFDAAERRRRSRNRALRRGTAPTAPAKSSFVQRPSHQYATSAQLQAAVAKLDQKISINVKGIKSVDSRINTTNTALAKQDIALSKEIKERKNEVANLKNNLQMAMLLPLLTSPTPITTTEKTTIGGVTIESGTKLATVKDDTMSLLLPFMLLGQGSGQGFGDNNMLLLAIAMMNK